MTASDFHRVIRNLCKQHDNTQLRLNIDDLILQLNTNKSTLIQHLHTLETLDMIQFHDEKKEVFSLTESGMLANLP